MSSVIVAHEKDVNDALRHENGIVIIQFSPPEAPTRVLEEAAERNPDIIFLTVDTTTQGDLAESFRIQTTPTLLLFREGIMLFRESEAMPLAVLFDVIEQARTLDMDEVRQRVLAEI